MPFDWSLETWYISKLVVFRCKQEKLILANLKDKRECVKFLYKELSPLKNLGRKNQYTMENPEWKFLDFQVIFQISVKIRST